MSITIPIVATSDPDLTKNQQQSVSSPLLATFSSSSSSTYTVKKRLNNAVNSVPTTVCILGCELDRILISNQLTSASSQELYDHARINTLIVDELNIIDRDQYIAI